MTRNDSRERVRSRVWKAIAQSEIDLSSVPAADQETLVDLVAEAAILEIDDEMIQQESADKAAADTYYPTAEGEDEQLLWKGRPILSISEHYLITNERVRVVRGLLGKEREDIELIRIQDIDHSQTLRERAVNVGDLTIHSHDRSHPVVVLNNIRDVQEVHEILRRAVIAARKHHKITFQEEM
ncbi:MAG: PH domain-containing protein [Chloroflexota bacterium]|nr:MAG: PH domain-containing protein [Chloroflexota bacterium]